jgi:hypothetical protein
VCLSPVRLSIHDPDASAIGLPSGDSRSKVLIRVSDALVIFLFKLVLVRVGIGIATAPKLLNESLSFVVRRQLLKSLSLFLRDDVRNILV